MAFLILMALASALCTERLGIHLLFGSFLMGAIMPKEPKVRALRSRPLRNRYHYSAFAVVLRLHRPAHQRWFAQGPSHVVLLCLIILVAAAGKLGGSMAAARLSGMAWREAADWEPL